ncbi:glycosyltransferase, partial [Helicobacter japonicus]|uniref:glycosyltransferase n=1 Tax=Helicobacter japonicus TaxID=425400 RepID=UPI0034E4C1F2
TAEFEREAFSCLEAISIGLVPIIADSKISATTQFALDERSLFKTNNIADLSAKIDYWIEHSKEREQMKEQYAKSAAKYALEKSIDNIINMYEEAITDFTTNPILFEAINT